MKKFHAVSAVALVVATALTLAFRAATRPSTSTLFSPPPLAEPVLSTTKASPSTPHRCSEHCDHAPARPVSRQRVEIDTPADWRQAEVGDPVALGFRIDDITRGTLTGREALPDGRTATGIRLPNGHDLHIVRRGTQWEGRAISRDGSNGWILRGNDREVTLEEVEHEALICSVVGDDGIESAGLPAPAEPLTGAPLPEPAEAVVPPLLNSRPGANGVIYLDFDGETVTGTQWNSSYNNNDPIVAAESGLTEVQIERVWAGIAEDYRPFNVNVTTDRSVYEGYPLNRRAMLIFSPTIEWYTTSGGVGGVAYVDIFGSSFYDYPGWVFTGALSYSASNCHEAGSHEAGHIVGLRHDGTSSLGYYDGHGSGATSWAPIMGVGYSRTVSQWSKGEYAGANNTEDDLAIITKSYNGLGYVPDDHANTIGGATPMTESGSDAVDASGLVETNTDVDLFSFQTSGGSVNFTASNGAIDPNLDIRMRLLDASGGELAVADPAGSLDAVLSATLGSGLHYLEISGTGTGDPTTGYSDYASLGGYTLTGTVPRVLELAADILSPSAPQVSLPAGTGLYLDGLTSGATPQWEILETPVGGSVLLSAANADATRAEFTLPGTYRLRLGVAAGAESASDEIEVSVEADGTPPAFPAVAPGIDLGGDRTIYGDRTVLAPVVTDDGLPGPPTYEWQVLSGDGQLSGSSIADPELVFASASTTRLRLTVSDGDHRTFREVDLTAVFFSTVFVAEDAPAAASVCDSSTFAAAWKTAGYDDASWQQGALGAGYDANKGNDSRRIYLPLIGGLDLEDAMASNYGGCLMRVPFEVEDPQEVLSLTLRMKFDDGFIAYLNGTEVARMNVPTGLPDWDSLASSDRFDEDALSAVGFPIAITPGLLVQGTNILAIHGMNEFVSGNGNKPDPEFLLLPSLEGVRTEIPDSPFITAVSFVTDPGLRSAESDADGDGRSNLLEHATGTNLNAPDDGYPPLEVPTRSSLAMLLPADPPVDVRYLLEHSETLGSGWSELARRDGNGPWLGTLPVSTSPASGSRERIEFPNPASADARGFFRLRFELLTP